VDSLQKNLETTQAELASLQHQADLSAKRLGRAAKLISALGKLDAFFLRLWAC
jgi:hypothetical protein